ncbi:hypothetical protein [Rhizobium sp. 18065]|uniref:hypothetical protein n=1 Tax=Rhizobium sp. 18065 TaxID=2681411 RepID=UPI001359DFC9|nr:hypothetical protein [Rhizobium sp. 18065]
METGLTTIPADARQRIAAIAIAKEVPDIECRELVAFIDKILIVRDSKQSNLQKLKATMAETLNVKVIWPTLKLIFRECRRRLWDNRSTNTRLGLTGSIAGLVFFGGQSAGIAAMGGAIGVPLWVVFGAGAMYANHLREALMERIDAHTRPHTDL